MQQLMRTILLEKLHGYIIDNNPEIMLNLQADFSVKNYLEQKILSIQPFLTELLSTGKPSYIIEELCLNALTADLRPSRFNYLGAVLEEEFEKEFLERRENGTLTYELVTLIGECEPIFESIGFTEVSEHDRHLRYLIIGAIAEYLYPEKEEKNQSELFD